MFAASSRQRRATTGVDGTGFLLLLWLVVFAIPATECARECSAIAGMDCLCSSSLDCKGTDSLTGSRLRIKTTARFKAVRLTFHSKAFVIPPNFFTPIANLLDFESIIDDASAANQLLVHITFPRFDVLALDNYAFANMFGQQISQFVQNRTKLSIDFYSEKSVTAYTNTFADLQVGHLELYGALFTASGPPAQQPNHHHHPSNQFSNTAPLTFESLFNHTSVSQLLRLEGIMLPSAGIVENFRGHINRLLVSKQVSQICASEFPFYSVVDFYTIFAHNARTIDGPSFAAYTNLKGLMIHSGQLHLYQNALLGLSNLRELTLDLEKVNAGALTEVADTLEVLELKSCVRQIDDSCLNGLNQLKVLDIRDLDFYILSYSTRCLLAQFVSTRLQQIEVLVSTKVNEPVESSCECHLLFILTLKRIPHHCTQKDVVEKCAMYATCSIVRVYFQELKNIQSYNGNNHIMVVNSSRLLSMIKDQERQQNAASRPSAQDHHQQQQFSPQYKQTPVEPVVLDIGGTADESAGTSASSYGIPPTLPNQQDTGGGIIWPLPETIKQLTTTTPSARYPSTAFSVDFDDQREIAGIKWIPIVIVCVGLVLVLVLALAIWFVTYRRRYKQFKPVSTNGAISRA